MSLALSQNKNLSVLAYVEVFWWARVDVASRASKKAPQGLFCPPDYSAGRCCSNPPSRGRLKMPGKTKNQRNFYAGPFGGRGWIRTTEAESSRFTVCPHWPLGNTPIFSFCSPWVACIYYHPDGSLSTSFAEFLDFCAESKNTKAKAAQKSTFLSGFLELVTGVERATGIASLKNGDFYTKICTFSCLFLVPSCTAHTPTKAKVC